MANKTLIGPYSAYAIAVKHGYQGTEAEWAKTLIDAGNNAASAAESKTAAAQSAENAATSETNVAQAEERINTAVSGAVEAVVAQETKSVQAVAAQGEASAAAVTAEGERVLGTIPEDYTELSNGVSQLKDDKVNKPSATDDGKIPRAKDGDVEWVNVGQPTDEQTAEAVTEWLNKHPEATTTVQEGSIGLKQISDEMQSVIVGVNSGIDSRNYIDAMKKGYIDTFVCSEDYKVYDFKNIIIKNLIVSCVSSIIKNVKVTTSFKISDGSRNCTFFNMRNEITTESVVFGENTWAHKFVDCTFLGNGDTICFKQGIKRGDTLICSNCYFYKMHAIFKPDKNGFAIIEGGWGDSIDYIIYADTFVNANYTINNYDFESIKNVLYTKGKASSFDLCINGVITRCDSIVLCDDPTNASVVNLIYNCNLLPRFKLFDDNTSFLFKTCNIVAENICNYPMSALKKEITLELFIPPKCYYEPFKSIIHLYSASWDEKYDDAITIYFGGNRYTKNTIYNGVKKFGILNKTENPVYFTFTIDTKNNLIN